MRTPVIILLFIFCCTAFSQQYKVCMHQIRSFHNVDLEQYTVNRGYLITGSLLAVGILITATNKKYVYGVMEDFLILNIN